MEVCGGHTHSIHRYGINDLLSDNIELIHSPDCPVCVLPMGPYTAVLVMTSANRSSEPIAYRDDGGISLGQAALAANLSFSSSQ